MIAPEKVRAEAKKKENENMAFRTFKPERLWSLYSTLDAVEVCPVAFEIFEELKQEYGFRYRRRR